MIQHTLLHDAVKWGTELNHRGNLQRYDNQTAMIECFRKSTGKISFDGNIMHPTDAVIAPNKRLKAIYHYLAILKRAYHTKCKICIVNQIFLKQFRVFF
ncbi:hypothetical protein EGR_10106 [Echinococcus granulosus]|uniref:Uncharacterized protein n=1 Tax=Echinococcus granulosus TaxID=6210 RepID=W6UNT7_ECHGR|nr:hypothetical protein EGR_10106 [Echinococcus granulosus]EUB55034.1 hypothetical protein EGR_10106 [Echinococcus granulosus]